MKCSIIVFLAVCWLIGCVEAEYDEDWPMYMHDVQHTGYSPSRMQTPLKELWRHEKYGIDELRIPFDPDYKGSYTRFVISDEKVLVLLHPSMIFSLDVKRGSLLWSVQPDELDTLLWSFPAATDDRMYAGMSNKILCLDSDTGDVLWSHETANLNFMSSPVIINNYVFVGGGEPGGSPFTASEKTIELYERALNQARRVLCLHADTGEIVWEFYADDFTEFAPAYFNDRIFVNAGRNVYCLNADTGALIWGKRITWTSSSSLSLDGKRIFVGTFDGVICLDIETGDLMWTFSSDRIHYLETPAVAHDKVYVGGLNGVFYCLDACSGELVWEIETESRIISSAVIGDENVIFGTEEGTLYIVNAQSGEIIENHELGNGITTLALSKGRLIVGQENGRIICFGNPSNHWYLFVVFMVITGIVAYRIRENGIF
ncbi:MAG: PQQ-binding-like beta-propeller repeat protein [Theionarchaea archaeon]|nr:PQQ-binding-like beta-propeller repeat protein [Theionarchaea archaeon]